LFLHTRSNTVVDLHTTHYRLAFLLIGDFAPSSIL